MTKLFLLSVWLLLKLSRACDGSNEEELLTLRQDTNEYFVNAFGFMPYPWNALYYQPRTPIVGSSFEFLHLRFIIY